MRFDPLDAQAHGFVGADLAALCREAAMGALRRLMPALDLSQARIPDERLLALEVTAEDFAGARRGRAAGHTRRAAGDPRAA